MSSRFAFAARFASATLATAIGLAALAPRAALAAGDCPDGWFCEDNAAPQPPATPGAGPRPVTPGPAEAPPEAPGSYAPPGEPGEPVIFVDRPENAPRPPMRRRHRGFHEWGFNLHLEDAILGNAPDRASHSGMGGLGFAFRYRPLPPLAFEAGIDLLTGTDYQGYSRGEAALLLNTLVFFNPHDVVQIYGLGGLGFSAANVTIAPRSGETFQSHDEHYSYFGAQAGLGVEVRVSHSIALGGDVVGFVRGRTDDRSGNAPEFEDPNTHRVTNASGGGLVRVGATFYW